MLGERDYMRRMQEPEKTAVRLLRSELPSRL